MQHPAWSCATSLQGLGSRNGRFREGQMHLIPEPFASGYGQRKVRTLCGRDIVPGSVWAPESWTKTVHLARTHGTAHCLNCVRKAGVSWQTS